MTQADPVVTTLTLTELEKLDIIDALIDRSEFLEGFINHGIAPELDNESRKERERIEKLLSRMDAPV